VLRKRPGSLAWLHAVLHPQSERELSGWAAYGKVTTATCDHAFSGSDATNAALAPPGASGAPQANASRSLCVLRQGREHTGTAEGPSCCGALLAQNAEQPELERRALVEEIPAWGAASSSCYAVNQLLKSVVRKICPLGSVGAGDGRPLQPPGGRFREPWWNDSGTKAGNSGRRQEHLCPLRILHSGAIATCYRYGIPMNHPWSGYGRHETLTRCYGLVIRKQAVRPGSQV
jgi:hypothetical protein